VKAVVALVGAAAVFSAVLLTTPPGFGGISDLLIVGASRGPNTEGAAYAVGAASTLALFTLLALTALGYAVDALRRGRR
jgi:hypothetical protein